MSKAIEEYNRFAVNLNKAKRESGEGEHVPNETIYLYAKKALPETSMKALEEHLEYCWHCGSILADAEEFQQICADVDAGVIFADVKALDFESLKARMRVQPDSQAEIVKPEEPKLPENNAIFVLPHRKRTPPPPQPEPRPDRWPMTRVSLRSFSRGLERTNANETITATIRWQNKDIELHILKMTNGIKIFTPEESVIGETLTVKTKDGKIELAAKFRSDPTKGMPASVFFRVENNDLFPQLLEIGIKEES